MQHGVKRTTLSAEARAARIEKDRAKIDQYKAQTDTVFQLRESKDYSLEALDKTTQLLLANPEFYTVWNIRREILLQNKNEHYPGYLEDDLKLLMGLLKRYPKCYWIWNHRRWCLFELYDLNKVNWAYEFAVVSKLLELDSRNFHGWQYRRFVVENIGREVVEKAPADSAQKELLKITIKEFEYTTAKINKDISNFSAWHNRSKLIPKLFGLFQEVGNSEVNEVSELFKSPLNILVHDLELVKTGMYMDSEDSSVWLYLYWLLTDKLFVNDLKSSAHELSYLDVLGQQLKEVQDLNELEKDDSPENLDNCWCLKTIILIKGLIKREEEGYSTESKGNLLTEDIKGYLEKLIGLDPLRKGKYLDQLAGKAAIIPV